MYIADAGWNWYILYKDINFVFCKWSFLREKSELNKFRHLKTK